MARDILGLGGPDSNVKNLDSTRPEASPADSNEAGRRRRRMSEGADELTPGPTGVRGGNGGATGIDMGDGGEGTDLE
jgi:hypothetical protein